MGELLTKIIDVVTGENSKGIKRLVITIIILLPIILILGNYFYGYIRLEQKVRILKELAIIKTSEIENIQLKEYYNSLVNTLVLSDSTSVKGIIKANEEKFDFSNSIVLWKFISGAFIGVLLMFVALFAKYEKTIMKLFGFLLMGFITALVASLGLIIPTLDPPVINYIGYPIIQVVLLVIGTFAFQKRKS